VYPQYLRSQVKPSCLYSTHRNAELWNLCNALFVCIGYPKAVMVKIRYSVLLLAPSVIFFWFFHFVCLCCDCESNISGTTERICAKFTMTTCLVARTDEFECQGQGQMSMSPGTKQKTAESFPLTMQCIVTSLTRTPKNMQTTCSRRRDYCVAAGGDGVTGVHADGGLRAVYVW